MTGLEEWRAIERGGYEISNFGRMRSWRKHGWQKRPLKEPYLLNPKPDKNGYLGGSFGDRKKYKIHRLVAIAFRGPPPSNRHQVAHNDGNALNNHADNIRWATAKENNADRAKHGTLPFGENSPSACLTEANVRYIRSSAEPSRALAARFGVTKTTINRARNGCSWRRIDGDVSKRSKE